MPTAWRFFLPPMTVLILSCPSLFCSQQWLDDEKVSHSSLNFPLSQWYDPSVGCGISSWTCEPPRYQGVPSTLGPRRLLRDQGGSQEGLQGLQSGPPHPSLPHRGDSRGA